LMKELGYGAGYQYAHSAPEAYIPQEYLPPVLHGSRFYEPGPFGFEKEIAKRLAWWEELRRKSDPDTFIFWLSRISAMPLMPMPPIPMKCAC